MAQACLKALRDLPSHDDFCITADLRTSRESSPISRRVETAWPGLGTDPTVTWSGMNQDGSALFHVKDFYWHGAGIRMVVLERVGEAWRLRDLYRLCSLCGGLGYYEWQSGSPGLYSSGKSRTTCTLCRPDHTEFMNPTILPSVPVARSKGAEWNLPDSEPVVSKDLSTPAGCLAAYFAAADLRWAALSRAELDPERRALEDLKEWVTPARASEAQTRIEQKVRQARKKPATVSFAEVKVRGDRAYWKDLVLEKDGDRWFIDRE